MAEDHSGEWLRLLRCLHHGQQGGFRLLLLECNAPLVRDAVMGAMARHGIHAVTLTLTPEAPADFAALERTIGELGRGHPAIHLVGWETWEHAGRGTFPQWNLRRERFTHACPVPLLVWLTPPDVRRLATEAPDLWAWRTAVLDFTTRPELPAVVRNPINFQVAATPERVARLAQIEEHLQHPDQGREDAVPRGLLLSEAGELAASMGDFGKARRFLEEAVRSLEMGGNRAASAGAELALARVEFLTGQLDGALARLGGVVRTFELLKDDRSLAVTRGHIADILMARGQLEEVLRIRTEEELPVYERLGDVRSRAFTQGKIADILMARGQLEEALRIRREEELPVYERLGDVRSRAVTQGKIADILMARGQLEEALRIRREEELPVYERLGDVRSRAVTQGKVADILMVRGQLEEALRIRTEEELPVYERLGDVRSRAVTQGKIADILMARGQLEEALRIRMEEELPVYERLGDVRSRIVTGYKVALAMARRGGSGDAAEASRLLLWSQGEARRLGLPFAEQIEAGMRSLGLSTPGETPSPTASSQGVP
ncbi:MAG: hypothetical protein WCR07_08595 [Verrucomicrobiota bacterium]